MKRYKQANEGVHAPEELKARAAGAPKASRRGWVGAAAAVLALAVIAGIILWPSGDALAHAAVIAQADYPKSASYSGSSKGQEAAQAIGALDNFYSATMGQFLGNSGGKNVVYSPLNTYMALAVLAELTGGESRAQILELLGVPDIGSLRTQVSALWTANYVNDGAVTSIPAASLWLSEDVTFVRKTMNTLADTYYTSSYRGEMGSDELNQALRNWLSEQTGGLLKEYTEGMELDADTVLALATTLYFQAKWAVGFRQDNNTQRTFHGADGDMTAEFMNQSCASTYYWADGFTACGKQFELGGAMAMWFILPDEGVSVDDLLADGQVAEFLSAPSDWENQSQLLVNFSMPKFNVSSQTDLIGGLKALGVTDVFDPERSDFTPMARGMDGIYVSQITHAARVTVDEYGCEAAAFSILTVLGGLPASDEEVDFVLDRPFLFAVTGETGQLLFVGVVNQP